MGKIAGGRVMVFGTFDQFHPGHRSFIEQASCLGDRLIIVVARDATVLRLKRHLCFPEQIRKEVLQKAFPSALVVLGDTHDFMKPLRTYQPDLICLGYDQVGFSPMLSEHFPELPVVRLEPYRPDVYKSSKISRVVSLSSRM